MKFGEYILYILETRGVPETTLSIVKDLSVGDGPDDCAVRNTAKRRERKLGSETALRGGQRGCRTLMDG